VWSRSKEGYCLPKGDSTAAGEQTIRTRNEDKKETKVQENRISNPPLKKGDLYWIPFNTGCSCDKLPWIVSECESKRSPFKSGGYSVLGRLVSRHNRKAFVFPIAHGYCRNNFVVSAFSNATFLSVKHECFYPTQLYDLIDYRTSTFTAVLLNFSCLILWVRLA
jgi:hypothetical protein